MKPEQISMFGMLDEWETPVLPIEQRNKDVKAWVIEAIGTKNSIAMDAPIAYWAVRARRVMFTVDAKRDLKAYSKWCTGAESCDGKNYFGWLGGLGHEPIFSKRPSYSDMEKFVRMRRGWREGTEIRLM